MKNIKYRNYYIISLASIIILSIYPIFMGMSVICDMLSNGTVLAENYPKYIIPYTPISISLIFGIALEPVFSKLLGKIRFAISSVASLAIFFVTELLFEKLVIVTETVETTLESWQMYMCMVTPTTYTTQTKTAIELLVDGYSPYFKLHFYIISALIIIAVLNCIYGFADIIKCGRKERTRPLVLQSIFTALFIGMCVFACFTAFYRTGELFISPLSAILMSLFFILFGLTFGVFVSSFAVGKRKLFSLVLPSVAAIATVLLMYVGEMILLGGNLYRYGRSALFSPMGKLVLSPYDVAVTLGTGVLCYVILKIFVDRRNRK